VGEPNRRPRPGRPGGNMSGSNSGRPPRFKRNKSTVQRSKNAIHSYDHLPSWAHPRYSRNP
ncbi:MAG: hypothetical protein J6Q81_08765, partial [Lentisphaeria bacterium]|nr:hypothetical protein [Lentisphaeria bacterium]